MQLTRSTVLSILFAGVIVTSQAGGTVPVPDKVACAVPDKQDFQYPDRVHLSGWLGQRIDANEDERLLKVVDPESLLNPFRVRRKNLGWGNEFVGKWLDAATLARVNSGDPALRKKLDYVASELIKCQLPDGYLGTYVNEDRWTGWDIWGHEYNPIGKLKDGQTFTLPLAQPVKVVAVRVLGVPAGGDDPTQAFSSCAELEAFDE